ncbi:MAG: hypothetical protein ACK4YF_03690, partial [Exilispira sp.]
WIFKQANFQSHKLLLIYFYQILMRFDVMKKEIFNLTCSFGLESICKKELNFFNIKDIKLYNGFIKVNSDFDFIDKVKYIKTINRVFYIIKEENILNYDDIYKIMKSTNLKNYFYKMPSSIGIEINTQNTEFISKRTIFSVVSKSLKNFYNIHDFKSNDFKLGIFIYENLISIGLDCFGISLHKRFYRINGGVSPIKENLASAIVIKCLKPYHKFLVDPFCGSSTILTEAILFLFAKKNPYLNPKIRLTDEIHNNKENEYLKMRSLYKTRFFIGSDIDENAIVNSKKNIEKMLKIYFNSNFNLVKIDNFIYLYKVNEKNDSFFIILINFDSYRLKDNLKKIEEYTEYLDQTKMLIITNLPYGKRLDKKFTNTNSIAAIQKIFTDFNCEKNFLSSMKYLPSILKEKPDKKRKLFNGKIEVTLFTYE